GRPRGGLAGRGRRAGPWRRAGPSLRRSARSAFHGRGMSVTDAWVQGFVATRLEMGEVAMRGRNRPPTEPAKFAVEFWDQIRAGRDIEEAAKPRGASITTCRNWFRHRGGVKPPQSYARSRRYLTFDEREDIAMYRVQGRGVRDTARRQNRDPATISPELRRAL